MDSTLMMVCPECSWENFVLHSVAGIKLVLPVRFLDELKSNPHLSFVASIDNVCETPVNEKLSMMENH